MQDENLFLIHSAGDSPEGMRCSNFAETKKVLGLVSRQMGDLVRTRLLMLAALSSIMGETVINMH